MSTRMSQNNAVDTLKHLAYSLAWVAGVIAMLTIAIPIIAFLIVMVGSTCVPVAQNIYNSLYSLFN
jgi:hypothetical protein